MQSFQRQDTIRTTGGRNSTNRTPRTYRSSKAVSNKDVDSLHESDEDDYKTDRDLVQGADSVESQKTGESLLGQIIRQVQEAMFKKAKHYVGHHVLVKEGIVHMQKAKERNKMKNFMSKNDEGFAKID